jgi:hypothetical protein
MPLFVKKGDLAGAQGVLYVLRGELESRCGPNTRVRTEKARPIAADLGPMKTPKSGPRLYYPHRAQRLRVCRDAATKRPPAPAAPRTPGHGGMRLSLLVVGLAP